MQQHSDQGTDSPSHDTGTRKGENLTGSEGKEPGRHEKEDTGAGRPAGGSTSRDSTGINPEDREPIDPSSPSMPPA
ncbi:MAG: hypothetical protein ACR2IH_12235 [Pyrinomonadaceae bacterium]